MKPVVPPTPARKVELGHAFSFFGSEIHPAAQRGTESTHPTAMPLPQYSIANFYTAEVDHPTHNTFHSGPAESTSGTLQHPPGVAAKERQPAMRTPMMVEQPHERRLSVCLREGGERALAVTSGEHWGRICAREVGHVPETLPRVGRTIDISGLFLAKQLLARTHATAELGPQHVGESNVGHNGSANQWVFELAHNVWDERHTQFVQRFELTHFGIGCGYVDLSVAEMIFPDILEHVAAQSVHLIVIFIQSS
jgi:hypothetical protein